MFARYVCNILRHKCRVNWDVLDWRIWILTASVDFEFYGETILHSWLSIWAIFMWDVWVWLLTNGSVDYECDAFGLRYKVDIAIRLYLS